MGKVSIRRLTKRHRRTSHGGAPGEEEKESGQQGCCESSAEGEGLGTLDARKPSRDPCFEGVTQQDPSDKEARNACLSS